MLSVHDPTSCVSTGLERGKRTCLSQIKSLLSKKKVVPDLCITVHNAQLKFSHNVSKWSLGSSFEGMLSRNRQYIVAF